MTNIKNVQPPFPAGGGDSQLRLAFKIIIALFTLVIALGGGLLWSWKNGGPGGLGNLRGLSLRTVAGENAIRKKFPEVDFSTIYPGFSPAEVDRLQRDCLGLRYVYAPFVEFEPLPVTGRFVNIVPAGYRKGRSEAPWPLATDALNVFVFGGSTTFGFGLPDDQTVVAAMEENLAARFPGRAVHCYNFGRGYYFSTQERQLFGALLAAGNVPRAAVFIDGLNDFAYSDGQPELAAALSRFVAPDLPARSKPALVTDAERSAAVEQIIARYVEHVRQTEALAKAYGVSAIFVGQPVPFLDFAGTPARYPFRSTYAEHRLCGWGYGRFKQAAREGRFGERFVWCGDAFANAGGIAYADSIHYSKAGASALAQLIVSRAEEVELWP